MTTDPPLFFRGYLYERVRASRWFQDLPERSAQEVLFACMYAHSFVHGTDGHTRLLLIADLARRLTAQEESRMAGGEG